MKDIEQDPVDVVEPAEVIVRVALRIRGTEDVPFACNTIAVCSGFEKAPGEDDVELECTSVDVVIESNLRVNDHVALVLTEVVGRGL
jgi:hypothetical protein